MFHDEDLREGVGDGGMMIKQGFPIINPQAQFERPVSGIDPASHFVDPLLMTASTMSSYLKEEASRTFVQVLPI